MTTHDFQEKLKQGQRYEAELDHWFSYQFDIARVTLEEEKRLGIDRRFVERSSGRRFTIQYKADEVAGRTGNAFVETVSVDTAGSPGWVHTCKADYIFYYVPGLAVCYIFRPDALREQLERWEKMYRTATAANANGYKTHGVLVPLDELERYAHAVVSM